MLGSTVGSYKITDLLGEGGMGAVYAAEHTHLKRKAAIKVLRDELSHDREVVARFFNEAKAATAVDHPGIISVFDFGYDTQGRAYIVMEYIEGETLAARRRRLGRLPVDEALTLCRQVAGALGAAHARGIVPRDLKPDNIMLVNDPDVLGGLRAKVLDFGIAKLLDPGTAEGNDLPAVSTKTGRILGTPAYMAPEQCRGAGEVDHRADMYALGCVLYALVCGRPPFNAVASGDLIAAHLLQEPPVPRTLAATIPPAVEEVILRLLAKRPQDRYDSMADIVAALEAASAGALPAGLGVRRSAIMAAERAQLALAATVDDVAAPPPVAAPAGPAADELAVGPTLGAAAHQAAPTPPATRSWRRPTLAAAALAAIAVTAVVWRARTVPTMPGASAEVAPHGGDAVAAGRSPEPAPSPAPAPAPATVTFTITSEPSNATIVGADDGASVGETPLSRSFPRGDGQLRFVLQRRGYQDAPVAIDAARDGSRHVVLRAVDRKRRAPTGGSPAATATAPAEIAAPAPAHRPARPIKDGALDPYAP